MMQVICNTMINQYSHSQGNYIMTYISLAFNYQNLNNKNNMCCNQFVVFKYS